MATSRRLESENDLPEELPEELPEDEPRLISVSDPSLYVVNFVHIILQPQLRRNVSDFVWVNSPEASNPQFEGLRHTRSLSELDQPAFSRPQRVRLATVHENGVASTSIEEENFNSSTTRPRQVTLRRRTQDDHDNPRDSTFPLHENGVASTSIEEENFNSSTTRPRQVTLRRRTQDDHDNPRDSTFPLHENGFTSPNIEEENLNNSSPTRRHQMAPLNRRRTQLEDNPRDFTFAPLAEENINLRERTFNVGQSSSTPPSYRSVWGSIRRN